jgi:hypothetical protein
VASYLLYLPDCKGADPSHLDRRGLGELRADRSPEFAECFSFGQGSLAYWHQKGVAPVLDTSLYDWTRGKGFSLGVLTGQRVTPDDVQRDTVRPGYWITCADGQRWQIPAAAKLPHRHGLNADGEHTREVVAQYRDYWDKSEQYAIQMFKAIDQLEILAAHQKVTEETVEFTLAETWDFACRALSINYRLTPEMVSMLGLIDDDAMSGIVKAAIDLPCLIEVKKEKKKELVGIPVGLDG